MPRLGESSSPVASRARRHEPLQLRDLCRRDHRLYVYLIPDYSIFPIAEMQGERCFPAAGMRKWLSVSPITCTYIYIIYTHTGSARGPLHALLSSAAASSEALALWVIGSVRGMQFACRERDFKCVVTLIWRCPRCAGRKRGLGADVEMRCGMDDARCRVIWGFREGGEDFDFGDVL